MVHATAARKQARDAKEKAHDLCMEAKALQVIEGAEALAQEKVAKAKELRDQARELQEKARLEDLSVRQAEKVKKTKGGQEKGYPYWVCSWREGQKVVTKYLGSCRKMTEAEAKDKARALKAEALAKSP